MTEQEAFDKVLGRIKDMKSMVPGMAPIFPGVVRHFQFEPPPDYESLRAQVRQHSDKDFVVNLTFDGPRCTLVVRMRSDRWSLENE